MSDPKVTLTYSLAPPESTPEPQLSASGTPAPKSQSFNYQLPDPSSQSYASFYSAVSDSVLSAQKDLNEGLTIWKDAIGDREKSKEDLGKVEYGKGKAARMMQYEAGRKGQDEKVEEEGDEEEDSE